MAIDAVFFNPKKLIRLNSDVVVGTNADVLTLFNNFISTINEFVH